MDGFGLRADGGMASGPALEGAVSSCSEPGCDRRSRRWGLCDKHSMRVHRGKRGAKSYDDRDEPRETPKDRLLNAVFSYNELETSDRAGWTAAWNRLRMAATRYREAKKQPNGVTTARALPRQPKPHGDAAGGDDE